ncbi:MAG: acetyl-CoA carboxylase biotin carboxyl carrier protein subunit [Deltaproteobacteria bacterium]|nr:acetyl-CoA carboxylase biotin carboxyl carrier protein subunit [Deltaproteobacteria bacterium]
MKSYKVKVNGKEYDVKLISRKDGEIVFSVGGNSYVTSIESKVLPAQPTTTSAAATPPPVSTFPTASRKHESSSSNHVKAPMPGVVAKIMTSVGQQIKLGESLLTIEAMKMENQIKAPKAGVVSQILVKESEEVQANQPLIELSADA